LFQIFSVDFVHRHLLGRLGVYVRRRSKKISDERWSSVGGRELAVGTVAELPQQRGRNIKGHR